MHWVVSDCLYFRKIKISNYSVLNHDVVYIVEIKGISYIAKQIQYKYLDIVFILKRSLHSYHLCKLIFLDFVSLSTK